MTTSRTLTSTTAKAITKYGYGTCREAYALHMDGNGASTVAHSFASLNGNTRSADAAINAGRELAEKNSI